MNSSRPAERTFVGTAEFPRLGDIPRSDVAGPSFGPEAGDAQVVSFDSSTGGEEKLVRDFVAPWDKVMNLGRFDRA